MDGKTFSGTIGVLGSPGRIPPVREIGEAVDLDRSFRTIVFVFLSLLFAAPILAVLPEREEADSLATALPALQGPEARDARIRIMELLSLIDPAGAETHLEPARELLRRHPDAVARYRCLVQAALILRAREALAAADSLAVLACAAGEQLEEPGGGWRGQAALALIRGQVGRSEDALALAQGAYRAAKETRDVEAVVYTGTGLGRTLMDIGRIEEAYEILLDSDHAAERGGVGANLRALLANELGSVNYSIRNHEQAIRFYEEAERIWRGEGRLEVIARANIAASLSEMKRHEEALAWNLETLELARTRPDTLMTAILRTNIVDDLVRLGRPGEALAHAEKAERVLHDLRQPRLQAWALMNLGQTLVHLERAEDGVPYLESALGTAVGIDHAQIESRCREALALAAEQAGRYAQALEQTRARLAREERAAVENQGHLVDLQTRFAAVKREQYMAEMDGRIRRERNARRGAHAAAAVLLVAATAGWAFWRRQRRMHAQLREQSELALSRLERIKVLQGLLPICSVCRKIRGDDGRWVEFDVYIDAHSEARFSHGYCSVCASEANARLDRDLA